MRHPKPKRRAVPVLIADPNYTGCCCCCCCHDGPLCVISHHGNHACASLAVSGQTKAALNCSTAGAHVDIASPVPGVSHNHRSWSPIGHLTDSRGWPAARPRLVRRSVVIYRTTSVAIHQTLTHTHRPARVLTFGRVQYGHAGTSRSRRSAVYIASPQLLISLHNILTHSIA